MQAGIKLEINMRLFAAYRGPTLRAGVLITKQHIDSGIDTIHNVPYVLYDAAYAYCMKRAVGDSSFLICSEVVEVLSLHFITYTGISIANCT